MKMQDENTVVRRACFYFRKKGYVVVSKCNTKQHGIDIVVKDFITKQIIYVEAKGQTSSMDSVRKGMEFLPGQTLSNWAKSDLKICQLYSIYQHDIKCGKVKLVLVFPYTVNDIKLGKSILPAMTALGVTIIMVHQNCNKTGNLIDILKGDK